ncbi:amidohydrolase [Pseudalkalibacillus decolorationis]|uniref:amidohydrolase n=1 Tax=Pseudalkalibacillus decolorationis TaxID=163879 RepID=UPI002149187A|nr:amidohydrolase [Pseudalkalibacillus decolorationis]
MPSIRADIVLSSNSVFTGIEEEPKKATIAIKGNRIVAIGSEKEIEQFIGIETKRYDFEDELIMAGFNDFHIHLSMGSLFQHYADLSYATSEHEAVEILKNFVEENDKSQWILGFSWYHVFWLSSELPHRSSLDRVFPDQPVCLLNSDLHAAWLNSKALEVLGINRDTQDPPFGKIIKDENGEPTGVLDETAVGLAKTAFNIPLEKRTNIFQGFLEKAAKYGVTSVSDILYLPGYDMGYLDTYEKFENDGKLSVRIDIISALNGKLDNVKKLREKYNSGKIRFSGLKQFLDGIPATYTAYFVDPYYDDPTTNGDTLIPPEVVKRWVTEADKEGFRIRLHACGDGAIRLGLDCYEAAQYSNGTRNSRHTIEHVETVTPNDLDRFSKLGVLPSMQPEHIALFKTFAENTYPSRLGPERAPYWPIKTLMNRGATIAFGSDFPVVSLNPMYGLYRAVTRVHSDGEPEGGWFPEEKISLAEALRAYTLGGAYGNFREDELGTLEVGKLADIVVLNNNLFKINAEEILNTKVKLTIVDGEVVHEQNVSGKRIPV